MNQLEIAFRSERRLTAVFNSVLVLLIMAVLFWAMQCESKPAQADDQTELITVQGLIAECDRCEREENELLGMLWVIEKNRRSWNKQHKNKRTFLDQAKLYFALFDPSANASYGARQESIRAGTFAKPTHVDRKHWVRLRMLVRRFLNGKTMDPHSEADHFGGRCDLNRAIRNKWKEVARYCQTDSRGREWCTIFWSI